jgi:hypothetical protein
MNFKGIDFLINDKNYKHFQSLTKGQREAIKRTMILRMLNLKDDYDTCHD